MLNGRKTIGVILFDITGSYQKQLVKYLSRHSKEKGYNLLVFSAFTIYGRDTKNSEGEYNILHLIPYEQLDAFIVCHDTFNSDIAEAELWNIIRERITCPVISMRRKVNNYYNILVDDTEMIPSLIRHLYEIHHFEHIAFFSGPYSHPDAVFRIEKYKETMKELALDYPEEYIFEGDFWKDRAAAAADHFMNLAQPPQAIVCANDHMALSLCKELTLRGYSVPQDIAITGFDDIEEASSNIPPLTTCQVSINEMASLAIDTIDCLFRHKPVDTCRYVKSTPVIRNSCGCDRISLQDLSISHMYQMDLMETLTYHTVHNTFISISLENMTAAEDIGDYLKLEDYPGATRDFYLCLGVHGNGPFPQVKMRAPGFAKRHHSIYSLKDLTPIVTSSFKTKNLLPPEAIREEPMCVYFFPIHHLEYNFGYVAALPNETETVNTLFHTWFSLIGNTLENARIRAKNEALLEELNLLYTQDSLTKLYNRRGFEQLSNTEYKKAQANQVTTMILGIDMDNLKHINDAYGHSHGDLALQTIADAMRTAAVKEEICARIGGDEFEVFGYDYNTEQAEQYISRFQQYLADFNQNSNLPYLVNASVGYTVSDPSDSYSLEHYMKKSDDLLYQHKRKRKKLFGNLSKRT